MLNKVIGEFLSSQQVWLHLLAELMYRVFGQLSRNSNANTQMVNEWLCLSLASFGRLKPFTPATWSLARTNGNLKLLFPCMRDTFGRSQQHLHSIILTIVYSVLREELQRQEDKMLLHSHSSTRPSAPFSATAMTSNTIYPLSASLHSSVFTLPFAMHNSPSYRHKPSPESHNHTTT